MGGRGRRRWPRRLALATLAVALAATLRDRRLAANARRYGLPG